MRLDEVLRTWKAFFEREGIPYTLIGGLAMHAWGYSRTTHDTDLAVPGEEKARVIAFAESAVPVARPEMIAAMKATAMKNQPIAC